MNQVEWRECGFTVIHCLPNASTEYLLERLRLECAAFLPQRSPPGRPSKL